MSTVRPLNGIYLIFKGDHFYHLLLKQYDLQFTELEFWQVMTLPDIVKQSGPPS